LVAKATGGTGSTVMGGGGVLLLLFDDEDIIDSLELVDVVDTGDELKLEGGYACNPIA